MITEMTLRLSAETADSVAYECVWKKSDGTQGKSAPVLFNKLNLEEDDVMFNLGVRWKDLAGA